jgi:hypothetical protein
MLDVKLFETDLLTLCNKYRVPFIVAFFRNGEDLKGVALGPDSGADREAAKMILETANAALLDRKEEIGKKKPDKK